MPSDTTLPLLEALGPAEIAAINAALGNSGLRLGGWP